MPWSWSAIVLANPPPAAIVSLPVVPLASRSRVTSRPVTSATVRREEAPSTWVSWNEPFLSETFRTSSFGGPEDVVLAAFLSDLGMPSSSLERLLVPSGCSTMEMTGASSVSSSTLMLPPRIAKRPYRTRASTTVASVSAPRGVSFRPRSVSEENGLNETSSTVSSQPKLLPTWGRITPLMNRLLVRTR